MSKPLEGIRVVEVSAWTFVPVAGAMLADMGAEVIKVEPPYGDPQRGLMNLLNSSGAGPNPFNEIPNRGKRSITLDLSNPTGREVLLKLCETADVFLTSYLPKVRAKLGIDVDDIRRVNPNIIYARGSGWGNRGPMRDQGGYDLACAWATSSIATRFDVHEEGPPGMPAAFFDLQGGNTIAGAIGTALFKRERTGKPSIVDVSLINVGMWAMAPDIVSAPYVEQPMTSSRLKPGNPITNWYRTQDRRWIYLVVLDSDRFWAEFCHHVGNPEWIDEPRYVNAAKRFEHRDELVADLDALFGSHSLQTWMTKLDSFTGVWAPALFPRELHDHPQVEANGYLPSITDGSGNEFRLVSAAMHFDEEPTTPISACPELGQDTESLLTEVGMSWDEISRIRETGGLG